MASTTIHMGTAEPTVGYYIAPGGSDSSGAGTLASPWASVSKFLALPPGPGDTLYCRAGTYGYTGNHDQYVTARAGSAGSPIIIRNYPGELPVFDGGQSLGVDFMLLQDNCAYWVIDGLKLINYHVEQSGCIWIGSSSAGAPAHHNTVRNCTIIRPAGLGNTAHAIYESWHGHDNVIEYNTLVGSYAQDAAPGACVDIGAHGAAQTNLTIRYNVFDGWADAIICWDEDATPTATGQILHNTFVRNGINIDLRYHSTYLVQDNAGETAGLGASRNLYDPNNPGDTTADHNYWAQTISAAPTYGLVAGDSAIDGGHDGSDAGWRAYP